jgi:hypothetical protein
MRVLGVEPWTGRCSRGPTLFLPRSTPQPSSNGDFDPKLQQTPFGSCHAQLQQPLMQQPLLQQQQQQQQLPYLQQQLEQSEATKPRSEGIVAAPASPPPLPAALHVEQRQDGASLAGGLLQAMVLDDSSVPGTAAATPMDVATSSAAAGASAAQRRGAAAEPALLRLQQEPPSPSPSCHSGGAWEAAMDVMLGSMVGDSASGGGADGLDLAHLFGGQAGEDDGWHPESAGRHPKS